ncbi:uncharacterized protein PGTG_09723 [Puccinia graminis f. sp. tritici CRL 75-36-700-3]|uniref:Vacuolar protein sorting-associated protein 52 n=1 Tax=Puccinia graminis f. sp. tritici (strain CRL 75-36-700-3 / race SCCL) TaxID=418459 RepID=E3KI85_PUCGT|nr:uncharacterized protein PGTG_09723 [Puccinia graminis f. sp. tritici CRL 75-36-700-3]EFP84010.2 hypothetical protein PGTG_09723 [Puccinia graminis f. sp. tritici CRL 75-36-700-3]
MVYHQAHFRTWSDSTLFRALPTPRCPHQRAHRTHAKPATPADFPEIAPHAAQLSVDLEQAYALQAQRAEKLADDVEQFYGSRKTEYEDLQAEIKASGDLLDQLSELLAHFQADLSSVSTSIAELQGRSKLIENRLEGRRLLEQKLSPYISNTVIPPSLISTIMSTEPSDTWLTAIKELEIRLVSLRTSSFEKRPIDTSDHVADKLRLVAAHKIRSFFISALAPFRASITTNLQITQSSFLLKYRPLFAFLQRHSARVANEVQKAYVGTARWYFETSFRRYVRALEKIKARGWTKVGLVGDPQSSATALDDSIISQSKLDGADVVLAYLAEDPSFQQPPEALFRSLSLVAIDNAISEWSFANHFFGQLSLGTQQVPESGSTLFPNTSRLDLGPASVSGSSTPMIRKGSFVSSIADSDSYFTGSPSEMNSNSGMNEQKTQTAIDLVFKQVIEPVFEYHKTFTSNLLTTNDLPDTNSIYAMIQLNEGLLSAASTNCPAFETHLMAIKMKLWPIFQTKMNKEIESVSLQSQRKEPDVKLVCQKYVWFFSTMIGMESPREDSNPVGTGEEGKVINELLKLREALVSFIQNHAQKLSSLTDSSRKSYLSSIYQEIQTGLMAFPSNHVRSQSEAAYWRELVWRAK